MSEEDSGLLAPIHLIAVTNLQSIAGSGNFETKAMEGAVKAGDIAARSTVRVSKKGRRARNSAPKRPSGSVTPPRETEMRSPNDEHFPSWRRSRESTVPPRHSANEIAMKTNRHDRRATAAQAR